MSSYELAKLDQTLAEVFELFTGMFTYLDGMAAQQFVKAFPYFGRQKVFTFAECAWHRFQNRIFTELRFRIVESAILAHRMIFDEANAIAEIDVALGHRIQARQQLQF